MIGQTSQITGRFNVLNSLGLVESGSSRYSQDEFEEIDDRIKYRRFCELRFRAHRIVLERCDLEMFLAFHSA
jgi:hypothetical protein